MKIQGFSRFLSSTGLPALLLAFLFLALPELSLYASDLSPEVRSIRREIQILDRTRGLAESELKTHSPGTGGNTAITRYISYLDARVERLCAELAAKAGTSALSGLNCPAPPSFLPGWQAPAARTAEENTEVLDRTLAEELGNFDELLAEEQKKIASARPFPRENRESGGYGTGAAGGMEQSNEDLSEGPGNEDNRPGASGQGKDSPEGEASGYERSASRSGQQGKEATRTEEAGGDRHDLDRNAPPPISRDDDIVARQLREAAEREKDPRLKKRLWEEYRKYKEGIR